MYHKNHYLNLTFLPKKPLFEPQKTLRNVPSHLYHKNHYLNLTRFSSSQHGHRFLPEAWECDEGNTLRNARWADGADGFFCPMLLNGWLVLRKALDLTTFVQRLHFRWGRYMWPSPPLLLKMFSTVIITVSLAMCSFPRNMTKTHLVSEQSVRHFY